MPQEERVQPAGELLAEISRCMVGLQKELGGRGPTSAKTYWAGEDTLLVVMGGGFTAAEETMYEGGKGDAVRDSRTAFADAVRERMKVQIRDLTGREVIAVISGSHQHPDVVTAIFLLEPREPDSPLRAVVA